MSRTLVFLLSLVACGGGSGDGDGSSDGGTDGETDESTGGCEGGEPGCGSGPMVMVGAGEGSTCALRDGAVRCWGPGAVGQLGSGNTEPIGDDETPASAGDVNVGADVEQLAVSSHTCAVLTSGELRCWGSNYDGQLGLGNVDQVGDDEFPADAPLVDVGGTVASVVVGGSHTCALLDDGAVRCWGDNGFGQLGYGHTDTIGDDELPASVGPVDVGGTVTSLVAGNSHTCAILLDDGIRCWGNGGSGRLGNNDFDHVGDDEVPADLWQPILTGKDPAQVVAGFAHTCALLAGGAVRCWGDGEWGQLGTGNTDPIYNPNQISDIDLGGTAVQIAAGGDHTCAVLDDGNVRCWGLGLWGMLGLANEDDIGDDELPSSVPPIMLGAQARTVATGSSHTCALTTTDTVRCWGLAEHGSLGYGNILDIGDDEHPEAAGDVMVW